MAQFARPSSDVVTDSWATAPLYSKINETSYETSTFINGPNKADGTCEIGLSSITDPSSSSTHVMRVGAYAIGTYGSGINLYVELYCGATLIKSWNPTLTTAFAQYSYTLTSGEADAITDYTDLRVKFNQDYITGAQGRCYVSWFEFEVPAASTPTNLTIENSTHIHKSTDAVVTTQIPLVIENSYHIHKSDDANITKSDTLVIGSSAHAHQAGDAVLSQAQSLAVESSLHIHKSGDVNLTQLHNLVIGDSRHSHVAENDNVMVTSSLTIGDSFHTHAAGDLILQPNLIIENSSHAHTVADLTLTVSGGERVQVSWVALLLPKHGIALVIEDSQHTHTADDANLTQTSMLTIEDSKHILLSSDANLQPNLLIQDSFHAHTAQDASLTINFNLTIENSFHILISTEPNLQPNLQIENSQHVHTSGDLQLTQLHILQIENSQHSLTSDEISLTGMGWISIENSHHTLTSSTIVLGESPTLVIEDSKHILTDTGYPCVMPMGILADIDHEDGTPSEYSLVWNDPGGHPSVSVSTDAGLVNTEYGLAVNLDGVYGEDPEQAYAEIDFLTNYSGAYTLRFYFDPNTLSIPLNWAGYLVIARFYTDAGVKVGEIRVTQHTTSPYWYFQFVYWSNGGVYQSTSATGNAGPPFFIQARLYQQTVGYIARIYVDGTALGSAEGSSTNHPNEIYFSDLSYVRIGVLETGGGGLTFSGTYYIDEIKLSDTGLYLDRIYAPIVEHSYHSLTSDEVVLTTPATLNIGDSRHIHISDGLGAIKAHELVIEDSYHTHRSEKLYFVTIIIKLTLESRSSALSLGLRETTFTLFDRYASLSLHRRSPELTLENRSQSLTLPHIKKLAKRSIGGEALTIADSRHLHIADGCDAWPSNQLYIWSGQHSHEADGLLVTMSAGFNLTIENCYHVQVADEVVLT